MFNRKTTFIIGAGCSAEYRMPLGIALKNQIVTLLGSLSTFGRRSEPPRFFSHGADELMVAAIRLLYPQDWRDKLFAAEEIADGISHSSSIDRYLDFHRDDSVTVALGKLAIARCILAAESNSSLTLADSGKLDMPSISKAAGGSHWMGELFSRLQEGVSRESTARMFDKVTFITFNYDRCIEHYLFNAIKSFSRMDDVGARRVLSGLTVLHPYGKIGRLEWDSGDDELPVIPFGKDTTDPTVLLKISEGIRIFTEQIEDGGQVQRIRFGMHDAEQIVFLGFSFLPQNMELLTVDSMSEADIVFATAFKEPQPNIKIAGDLIKRALKGRASSPPYGGAVVFEGLTAGDFLFSYGNRLRG